MIHTTESRFKPPHAPILKAQMSLYFSLPKHYPGQQDREPLKGPLQKINVKKAFQCLCLISQVVLGSGGNKGAGVRKSISAERGSFVSEQSVQERFGIFTTDWFEKVRKTSLRYDLRAADPAWDWRMNTLISWGPTLSTFMPGLTINVRIFITFLTH